MMINIIGGGFGMDEAPHEGICWGVNNVIHKRDVNVMFDMHDHAKVVGPRKEKCQRIAAKCTELDVPVFSVTASHDNYIEYPIEDIVCHFGTQYFSNAICYMIALALYQGATEIHLYGVNFDKYASPNEYRDQRAGVDYWVGFARGSGVPVKVYGKMSQVAKTLTGVMYGYEDR